MVALLVIAMGTGVSPLPAFAQTRTGRVLRAVEVDDEAGGWTIRVRLDLPARYVDHRVERGGRTVSIRIEPLEAGALSTLPGRFEQTLPIPRRTTAPLVEVTFEQRGVSERYVVLEFSQPVRLEVGQGSDLRALEIDAVPVSAAARTDALDGPPRTPAHVPAGPASGRVAAARLAIRDGELDRAIALLTKVLDFAGGEASERARQEARELLGITRERRGQFAHARAEYELYLEQFPEAEGADRVRQRLDALITASSAPTPGLRSPERARARARASIANVPIDYDVFGGLGLRWFRTEPLLVDEGFVASDVLTDFDLAARVDAPAFDLRLDFTGLYDADVAEDSGRTSDLRISRLSVTVEDEIHDVEVTVGRQRRSDGGVLGRFDGVHVRGGVGWGVSLSGVAGLPVTSTSDSTPDTDLVVFGGAIEFEEIGLDGLRGQIFAVARQTASMTDRAAVGGELRLSTKESYSFFYFDYDFLFEALNTAILSGAWYWTEATHFRAQVERRATPIFQLRTALQGQSASTLEDLRDVLSEDEVRALAKDRTQFVWAGSTGVTHRLDETFQLSGDLYVSWSSSTKSTINLLPAGDGNEISGIDAVGPNVSVSSQLLVDDWPIEDGIASVSLRYFEGDTSRAFVLSGFGRVPLPYGIRVSPRALWEWRDSRVQSARSTLRPSLELEWRESFGRFDVTVDAEGGIEWVESLSSGQQDRSTSYFAEVGVRCRF